jgi:Cu(I)/Ag(I) efflux system membrane fusion protein
MKTKTLFSLIICGLSLTTFLNCTGKKNGESSTADEAESSAVVEKDSTSAFTPQFQVDAQFQQQLANVFQSYVALKDAFVSSDASKVKTEAGATAESLSKVDMAMVSGAAHNDWMNFLGPIQSSLKEIQASSDLEQQRKSFSTLSDNLYKSIKAFGLGGKEAFYEFCPMAFNNEGGYWLSDKSQIRNPYFGDKMLTCGEVKEKLN